MVGIFVAAECARSAGRTSPASFWRLPTADARSALLRRRAWRVLRSMPPSVRLHLRAVGPMPSPHNNKITNQAIRESPICLNASNFVDHSSACCHRPPCVLGISPIDPIQHVSELRRRDRNDTGCGRGPNEPAALQPHGIERHADAVMPENFDQRATVRFIMHSFVRCRAGG